MNLFVLLLLPCLQCKHFKTIPKDNTYEHAQCDKFLKYADIARKDESKCGASGKFFVSKEKKEKE
jgi:hypothetical protein